MLLLSHLNTIKNIKAPIESELLIFEKKFRESMKSKVPLLDRITHYIVKRKGKQIRPMLVFLSAKMFGEINNSTYTAASLIELLHTATLVHDDVVDDSFQRRGFFSLNALWKNKIAVLVGDYLLSKGLLLAIDNKEFQMLELTSTAVREMSEGELRQMEKSRSLNIEESVYFKIIEQKTASLIAACVNCGAASAGVANDLLLKVNEFGIKVGTMFQIKDDLFDYGAGQDIGKPTGIDIKEKKTTLPLIYALNNCENGERKKMIHKIKNHGDSDKKIKEIIEFVVGSGGIEYATKKMNELKSEALEILELFPQNEANIALRNLVEFTVSRSK